MPAIRQTTPWEIAGVSRATYFRRKKDGKPLKKEKSHKQYISDWLGWRESGLSIRPWSPNHKEIQLYYLNKYLKNFRTASASNLEAWLAPIPTQSFSKRKHMHSAVSAFSKYLNHRGIIDGAEYMRIKALCPKRSPYHPPKQRIIYEEDLNWKMQEKNVPVMRRKNVPLSPSFFCFLFPEFLHSVRRAYVKSLSEAFS